MQFISRLFGNKSKNPRVVFPPGFVDYHCHILPGVDDGVNTLSDSLEILDEYEALGITDVWLTPHIMEDCPNTTDFLKSCFDELNAVYSGRVKLNLASENMLDELFLERLENNDLLPIGKSTLLVETSYYNPPMGLFEILDRIVEKGYKPLLAHPERYVYMSNSDYEKLLSKGVMLQLNMLSLDGFYGKDAQTKSHHLAKANKYRYIGTDLHSASQLKYIKSSIKSSHSSVIIKEISGRQKLPY